MKICKPWICLLAAVMLAGTAASCGKKTESVDPDHSTLSESSEAVPEPDAAEEEDDDAPVDTQKLVIKGMESETDKKPETKPSTAVTTQKTVTESKTETTASPAAGHPAVPETAAASSAASSAAAEQPVPTEAPTENVVSGVLYLDSKTFEGQGITVNGDTMTITGEGTYILNGNMTGMVEVNTTQKVKLKLNGVNIQNPSGPAILVTDAKRLTITLIEGTVNTLTDGVNTMGDGAVCSNDTLEIKGAGALYVNANNAHGISCDDDIIVKNGDIYVNAVKSGMMANDDITVSGGQLHVTGGTNGIKSKGTMHITGGNVWSVGGSKENKSALYSAGAFQITGGCVYAVGCGAALPDGTSTQHALCVRFAAADPGNVSIDGGGWSLMSMDTPYAYNTVFVSTPDIGDGMTCRIFASGRDCGDAVISGMVTELNL